MSLLNPAGVHTWGFAPTGIVADPMAPNASLIQGWDFDWQLPAEGDFLTIMPLTGYTVNVANSSTVALHDLSIYAAPNKAITELDGPGSHSYTRIYLGRRPGDNVSLLAANSDAFHSAGTRLGPTLRNSEFGWCGDDFFNIHSTLQILLNRSLSPDGSPRLFVVEPLLNMDQAQLYGVNSAYGTALQFEHATIGMRLSGFDPSTLAPLGPPVQLLTDPVPVVDEASLRAAEALYDVLVARGLPVAGRFGVRLWQVATTTPDDSPSWTAGTLLTMDDWSAAQATVLDNHFHDGYCTAGRLKCPNCSALQNRFERAVIHSLQLVPLPTFLEGHLRPANMTFAGNVLSGCGRSPLVVIPALAPGLVLFNNTISP
jgi:hypothetical protein